MCAHGHAAHVRSRLRRRRRAEEAVLRGIRSAEAVAPQVHPEEGEGVVVGADLG